jgi:YesN/AraC family two-component response regulator
MIFYKPMIEHRLVADKNVSSNVCVISFECNSTLHEQLNDKVFRLNSDEKYLIATIYEEASKSFELTKLNPALKKMKVKNTSTLGSTQLIQNSLEHLLINVVRKNTNDNNQQSGAINVEYDDQTVNAIIEYMNENICNPLSLSEISDKIGYGTTFLCSRFKSVTGKSILRYFTELKISYAKKMIRAKENYTVSEISNALNFCEPAYFCSVFKKITGLSPKEYSRTIHAYDLNK